MSKRRRTINRIENRAPSEDDGLEEREEEVEGEEDSSESEDGEERAKPKKVVKKKAAAPKKSRTPKVVRMRAVWIVFSSDSKPIQTFPYNQKADAEALVEEKNKDKKGGCYLQRGKEPIEEA
ncbi:hypothetical protein [Tuwongella immobilis]|uniref:Uncharacterized protein n=1 Tax=Tuwongella immobilis TaxID=692036 RepID=A0A6C2YMV7_9BACT|nr:hypothetical protein [Tuwongella immobilis]VIP02453.1 Putative uncharacterized protein OS=uncultured planctomycete GN=HGMM_F11G08C26 PE=4 SV=1 [Tuwongella immobilis]VTS01444.1 Putative uncharacterized protein OS=uncultured planctomycete GN=HGMM_F11G08C26 PE=4 SV=1 [Tuwongella immobilis]